MFHILETRLFESDRAPTRERAGETRTVVAPP